MDVDLRENGVFVFGPFRLNPVRRTFLHDGRPVALTARLFDTLLYIVQNPDRLVERGELEQAVWRGRTVEDGNLQKAVSGLRKVLQQNDPGEPYIVTVPGRGLRFSVPVRFEPEAEPMSAGLGRVVTRDIVTHDPAPRRRKWVWAAVVVGVVAVGGLVGTIRLFRPHGEAIVAFAPPPRSVAVLAFTNLSGDAGQDYFSDGLSEELINALSRVDSLQVAARTSSFSFKGGHATVGDIARVLNVGAVLEGSVRRDGPRMRVTAQLIDARTGFHFWSKTYDRTEGDVLGMQTDIAEAVTTSLQVTLLGADVAKLTQGSTANPAAMDLYLHGMKLLRSGELAGMQAARDAFDQAIALDGHFARGYSGRSFALLNVAMNTSDTGDGSIRKMFDAALVAADRSVTLAPGIGAGHAARASVLDNGLLDPAGAAVEAALALALEPGNAGIQGNFALVALDVGHVPEAIAAARRAAVLDPLRADVWYNLAYVLFGARRYGDALEALQHVRALDGHLPPLSYDLLGRIDIANGDPAAALRDAPKGSGLIHRTLAMAYHALGKQDAADAEFAKFNAEEGNSPFGTAELIAQWGRKEEAADLLEKAYEARDPVIVQLRADPLLDPIRGTPQFKDVEKRLHFPL